MAKRVVTSQLFIGIKVLLKPDEGIGYLHPIQPSENARPAQGLLLRRRDLSHTDADDGADHRRRSDDDDDADDHDDDRDHAATDDLIVGVPAIMSD